MEVREDLRGHLAARVRGQDAGDASHILALARYIAEHGVPGRFYAQVRPYLHEGGKVYWTMSEDPEEVTLVNRCDEAQTYEARVAAGEMLPE